MVLDRRAHAGHAARGRSLPIATDVLELEITPNRPDCLGVYGVAREVHAATEAALAAPPWADDPHPAGDAVPGFGIHVDAPDLCPRFTARLFEDVRLGPSPPWLKARLMAAGQRPISNVVDITNYVMLLTGQPMHAFDADLVAGGRLTVRRGRAGETMTTLDDVDRTLDRDVCVIEDAEGATSIAGIMGGARSEVRAGTTRVLMEAATWNGPNIQRTSHAARPPHRGLWALREGAPARAGARQPGRRERADARAVRRPPRGRDDRRRRAGRPSPRSCRCGPRGWPACSARPCRCTTPRRS